MHLLSKRKYTVFTVTILLLMMWGLLTFRINARFFSHFDGNGAWIGAAVRNYEILGSGNVGFLPVITFGPTTPESAFYYVNHPPLIVWAAAGFAEILGYSQNSTPHEMAVRLMAIFPSILSLALFYIITRRLYNRRIALLAVSLYAFTPMIAYFGRMPNHEAMALLWLYSFIAVYLQWMRHFTWRRTFALVLFAGLAMWTAWAPAFFFVMLGLVAFVYGHRKQRIGIVFIGLITLLLTLAIPLFYEWQHPGAIDDLLIAFTGRTSNRAFEASAAGFTWLQFAQVQLGHMVTTMTFAVVLLGAAGLFSLILRKKRLADSTVLAMACAGFLYILVFRHAAQFHDYYKIYLMPGFSIAAAIAICKGWQLPRKGLGKYARPLIFAIVITSLAGGGYWFGLLHQSFDAPFPKALIADLPAVTQGDDLVLFDSARPYDVVAYYTYRNIEWGASPDAALEFAASRKDVIYVMCEDNNPLDARLSQLASVTIAERCVLVRLS